MCVEILKERRHYDDAREELRRLGVDCGDPSHREAFRQSGSLVTVGDHVKSWDVLKSVEFIAGKLRKDASILDIGAFASEMPCILHELGYSRLNGVDMNLEVSRMPYADSVRYTVSDFMSTPFDTGHFDAITAISVIEHGFDSKRLLSELSRLLKPGGYFIASVDYWEEKIPTDGLNAFGMSWRIFSRQELLAFFDEAAEYGLFPAGVMDFSFAERVISWNNRDYTFAWFVLKKCEGAEDSPREQESTSPSGISESSVTTGRIAFLSTYNQPCGLATHTSYIISGLRRTMAESPGGGREILILAERRTERVGPEEDGVFRCWQRRNEDFSETLALIRQQGVVVLHIQFHPELYRGTEFLELLRGCRSLCVRVFITFHAAEYCNPLYAEAITLADRSFVHLPQTALRLIAFGAPPEKIQVVTHGILSDRPVTPLPEAKRRAGIQDDVRLITSFGFFRPHKGVKEIIEAFPEVLRCNPNAVFLFLGGENKDDPQSRAYIEICRQTARSLGIDEQVIFRTGFLPEDEVGALLSASDVIILNYLPNANEISGAACFALSHRRPMITSNTPAFDPLKECVLQLSQEVGISAAINLLLASPRFRDQLLTRTDAYIRRNSYEELGRILLSAYGLTDGDPKNHPEPEDSAPSGKSPLRSRRNLPGFNVIGYVSSNLGAGVTARNIVQLLLDQGSPVSILDIDAGLGRGKADLRYEHLTVSSPDTLGHPITLFVLPPFHIEELLRICPSLLSPNRLNVAFSMWELTVLPPNLTATLEKMDAVVAESDYIRHAFAFNLSNVFTVTARHPIYLPEGIRPDRAKFGLPVRGTLFISSFEPYSDIDRKNPFAVIEAFRRAFPSESDAYLVLKINNAVVNGHYHPVLDLLRQAAGNDRRIRFITETFSYVETLSLYASCNIFVSLHRAEGLGLGLMEAMLLGKPVIATAWSGNMSFMDHASSCPVSYRLVPVTSGMSVYSREYLGKEALWADPDLDDAAGWMRRLFLDKGLRERIGERGAESMRQYHEEAVIGRFLEEISALAEKRRAADYPPLARNDEMLVSIIIPLYNKVEYTRRCLEGIASADGGTIRFELILVDNASSDATPSLLQSLSGDVRIITNGNNFGFARACNQGAHEAKGKYLLFLNNDTIPHSGWMEALLRGIEEDCADIVGAKLLYPDDKVQHAGIAFESHGIGYHIFKNFPSDAPAVNKKRFMQCVTGACMLISRTVFEELGGFDETFFNGFEDVDLCLRAGTIGKRILYTPESILIHFEETSEGRKTHDERNLALYLSRWKGKVISDDEDFYREEGFLKHRDAEGNTVIVPFKSESETVFSKSQPEETDTSELELLCNRYQRNPEDRQNTINLILSLKRAGYNNDARRICSIHLQGHPDDAEAISVQKKLL